MHWFLLILSAVAEALFGIATFYSRGYTQLWPSIGAVAAGASTAVWSGLAAVGTVVFGIIYLGESRSMLQLGLIATILAGVVGLKLISPN
jgi:quaternary ammonium compound-resistance protein SugE